MEEGKPISPAAAQQIAKESGAMEKTPSGSKGFDWISGGGFLRGKAVSLSGPEGAGKTSFLAKMAILLEQRKIHFLLCSSEQSPEDLVTQFERYGKLPQKYVSLVHETNRDKILRLLERERPEVAALDSVHDVENVTDEDGNSMASGGARAVHSVAKSVRDISRDLGIFSFLVCHLNNDGSIKGGASLRHEVDGTLIIELLPEENNPTRILRFKKYRFAPPNRRARFLMLDDDFKDCGPILSEEEQAAPAKQRPDLRLVPPERSP